MRDLTPASMKCALSISCPAVHELADGKLLIVGKTCGLTREELDGDGVKVGRDETAIIIDRALLANVDPFPSNYKAPDNPYEGIEPSKPEVWDV